MSLNAKVVLLFEKLRYQRDGVVVTAPASQSVDLGFIPLVKSYQKTLKNCIRSFLLGARHLTLLLPREKRKKCPSVRWQREKLS